MNAAVFALQFMLNLELSFLICLKIQIHMLMPSTEKYPILDQLLASCELSSSRIIHWLTVHSQQRDRRQMLSA